ncbi:MAG: hypothetical protein R3B39_01115 [Candidatus Paceibacterota bacterium]
MADKVNPRYQCNICGNFFFSPAGGKMTEETIQITKEDGTDREEKVYFCQCDECKVTHGGARRLWQSRKKLVAYLGRNRHKEFPIVGELGRVPQAT